jgi:drug/metabolite transporter (DMT)-like permease
VSERSTNPWLPAAAAAAASILVGSGIVATRFVIDQTDPASLALLRYAIGFCCLLPAALMAERVRFERRDIVPISVLGITQFGILIALLNYGLQTVPSAQGSLIFATFPFLTMILAALLRYESLSLFKTLGVALTIAGVGLALSAKLAAPAAPGFGWIGELAIFASALSGAVCSVFYRPYLTKYSALAVGAFAMLASILFLAVLAAFEGFFAAPPRFSAAGWGAVAFIGVSSGVGYFLWLWALEHTTPTRVTIFLALSPITATALGWLWLSEAVSALFLLGLASVAGGLWIAHRQAAPRIG